MGEANKRSGGPQVYDGQMSDLAKRMEDRRGASGRNEAGKEPSASPVRRKREQENITRMKILGIILGILIMALIAALIYEVALGHGTIKTRNERVAEQQETARVYDKLQFDTDC